MPETILKFRSLLRTSRFVGLIRMPVPKKRLYPNFFVDFLIMG
jgi:hypothetical protein